MFERCGCDMESLMHRAKRLPDIVGSASWNSRRKRHCRQAAAALTVIDRSVSTPKRLNRDGRSEN
jgi:hypothetical protein